MIAGVLSILTGKAMPYVLAGLGIAAAAGWIWWQSSTIESLRVDVQAATDRAEAAESANATLTAEMDRQAAERVRNEAALAAERDAALARARRSSRALQEIRNAADADQPFSPGVADALRRLHGPGAGSADAPD